ncbi:MAG: hypothetical protein IJO58_04960 [Clostridia bacterium]|nr:hypothetical protein [Clostridia bacterium]
MARNNTNERLKADNSANTAIYRAVKSGRAARNKANERLKADNSANTAI